MVLLVRSLLQRTLRQTQHEQSTSLAFVTFMLSVVLTSDVCAPSMAITALCFKTHERFRVTQCAGWQLTMCNHSASFDSFLVPVEQQV